MAAQGEEELASLDDDEACAQAVAIWRQLEAPDEAAQAGMPVRGLLLARRGLSFLIVEANARIGDSWRKRRDWRRLFTPAKYDGLIGMPFPAPPFTFPPNS